jgi:ketosteroid isomerase-like protein
MRKICLISLLFLLSCSQEASLTDAQELIAADKAFSAMCAEKGMEAAFLAFAADDVIKLQPNQPTIMNKKELMENFKRNPEDAKLKFSWEPLKADVSGDIGYTFGKCKIILPPDSGNFSKVIYINYVTVWKKQKDGSWKYQVDGGNTVPSSLAEK